MYTTITTPELGTVTIEIEKVASLLGTRFYHGVPKLKQLPYLKLNYRGKNVSGGRKCMMKQSKEYRKWEKQQEKERSK